MRDIQPNVEEDQILERLRNVEEDRMMKWFAYVHLPDNLRIISSPFHDLAHDLCRRIDPGPERTVMLRKLLESKDAAVRAVVHPGG